MEARARVEGASVSRAALWFDELQSLAPRFRDYGIGPDLAGLTLAQAWELFMFLRGLAAGGADA